MDEQVAVKCNNNMAFDSIVDICVEVPLLQENCLVVTNVAGAVCKKEEGDYLNLVFNQRKSTDFLNVRDSPRMRLNSSLLCKACT